MRRSRRSQGNLLTTLLVVLTLVIGQVPITAFAEESEPQQEKNAQGEQFQPDSTLTVPSENNISPMFQTHGGSLLLGAGTGNAEMVTVSVTPKNQADFQAAYGAGTITINGQSTESASVEQGSSVTLQATAAPGWEFVRWYIGTTQTSNPYTFTALGTTNVTAYFQATETCTVTLEGSEHGGTLGTLQVPAHSSISATYADTWYKGATEFDTFYKTLTDGDKTYRVDHYTTASSENFDADTVVEGNITVYASWNEQIDSASIAFSAPDAGTTVTSAKTDWGAEQFPVPAVSVPSGAHYSFGQDDDYPNGTSLFLSSLPSGDPRDDLLNGTMVEGTTYYFNSWLVADDGYFFADDFQLAVNGATLSSADLTGADGKGIDVYASFTPATASSHEVSFNMGGHYTDIQSQQVPDGEKATRPANPTNYEHASDYDTTHLYFDKWTTVAPANLTYNNYWYSYGDGDGAIYSFNTAVTEDLQLYANYWGVLTISPYDVTNNASGGGTFRYDSCYYRDGGTFGQSTQLAGTTVKLKNTPNDGYEFLGWSTSTSPDNIIAGSNVDEFEYAFDGSTTLYPLFKLDTVTVAFNTHGGDPATIETQTIPRGDKITGVNDPVKSPFTFAGWYDNLDYTGNPLYLGSATFSADETTLHARWKAGLLVNTRTVENGQTSGTNRIGKVKINDGAYKSFIMGESFDEGTSITLTANPETDTDYAFVGWSKNSDIDTIISTDPSYPLTFNAGTLGDSSMVFLWANFSSNYATVSFETDPADGEGTMDSVRVAKGTEYTLPQCGFNAKHPDRAFDKWQIGEGADAVTKNPGETYTIPDNADTVTVKALWKDVTDIFVFPVTASEGTLSKVEADGQRLEDDNFIQLEPGSAHTLVITPATGYAVTEVQAPEDIQADVTFAYDRATGGATVTTPALAKGAYLFFVTTAPAVTVSFDLNGVSGTAPADQIIPTGGKATEPARPTDPQDVWTHYCWFVDSDYPDAQFNFNTAITQNTKLVAGWCQYVDLEAINKATNMSLSPGGYIKASGRDAHFSSGFAGIYKDENVTFTACPDDGHAFLGWCTSYSSNHAAHIVSTDLVYSVSGFDGQPQYLAAVFAEGADVTFNANGGSGEMTPNPVTVEKGSTYELPDCSFTPPDAYHVFGKWNVYNTAGLNGRYDPGDEITVNADTAVTAIWYPVVRFTTTIVDASSSNPRNSLSEYSISSTRTTCLTPDAGPFDEQIYEAPIKQLTISAKPATGYAVKNITLYDVTNGTSQAMATASNRSDGSACISVNDRMFEDGAVCSVVVTVEPAVTVTFDLNGVSGTTPAKQIIPVGSKATAPAEPSDPQGDWYFVGWLVNGDYSQPKFDFNTALVEDTRLVAGWTQGIGYSVFNRSSSTDYDEGVITISGKEGRRVIGSQSVFKGQDVAFTAHPNNGYVFVGWCEAENYTPSSTIASTETTYSVSGFDGQPDYLTAVFAETVDVTFKLNGGAIDGSTEDKVQTIEKNTEATDPGTPVKNKLTFAGWFNGGMSINLSTTAFDANVSLEARYNGSLEVVAYDKVNSQPYTGGKVRLDDDDPWKTSVSISELDEGSTQEPSAQADNNFRFVGWAIDDPAGEIVSTNSTYTIDSFAGNMVVYALFIPTATITFDNNGGTVGENWWNPNPTTVDTGTALGELLGRSVPSQPPADVVSAPAGKYFDGYEVKVGNSEPIVLKPGDPISVEVTAATTVTYKWRDPILTVHWSSIDGVDLEEALVCEPVAAGSTYAQALATINKQLDDKDYFEKAGYEDWGYRTPKPMSAYSDLNAMYADDIKGTDVIETDMDIYVDMIKQIDKVQLALEELPVCGTEVTMDQDEGRSVWATQSPVPNVTLADGAPYRFDTVYNALDTPWCFWVANDGSGEPFVGVFEGGKDYSIETWLRASFGYTFTEDVAADFDGTNSATVEYDGGYVGVFAKTTAVHVPGQAKHENEVAATCTEPGSYDLNTYCTACEKQISSTSEVIPPLGEDHDWGEWTVVEKASADKPGVEKRDCKYGDKSETREFAYSVVSGNGSTWTIGSNDGVTITFKRSVADDGTYGKFIGAKVDGNDMGAGNYSAESGSLVFTILPVFLESLSEGEHTLSVSFEDADAVDASFTVVDAAATDDENVNKIDDRNANKVDDNNADKVDKKTAKLVNTGDMMFAFLVVLIILAAAALGFVLYSMRMRNKK